MRAKAQVTLAAIVFALFVGLSPAKSGPAEAEQYVLMVANSLLKAVHQGAKTDTLTTLLKKYVNVSSMAKRSLGRYKEKITDAQMSEYRTLWEGFIVRLFQKYANSFKGKNISVFKTVERGKSTVVKIRINFSGGKKTPIQFRVQPTGGRYLVYDVNVQGVWLLGPLRDHFQCLIKKGGGDVEALLAYLRTGVTFDKMCR